MTACIDLSWRWLRADLGFELSKAVAQKMVLSPRTGGQSQFSQCWSLEIESVESSTRWTMRKRNLRQTLSVGELARWPT